MKSTLLWTGALSLCVLMACSNADKRAKKAATETHVSTQEIAGSEKTMSKTAEENTSQAEAATPAAPSEGRRLLELSFASVDKTGRGWIDVEQSIGMADQIHVSMDGDDDGNVTQDEFMSWGYGLQNIAKDKDRQQGYETALKTIYELWDDNGDGKLTMAEHVQGIKGDFKRTDQDQDGKVTQKEFMTRFPLNLALKAALKD